MKFLKAINYEVWHDCSPLLCLVFIILSIPIILINFLSPVFEMKRKLNSMNTNLIKINPINSMGIKLTACSNPSLNAIIPNPINGYESKIENIDNPYFPDEDKIREHMLYLSACQFEKGDFFSGYALKTINELQHDQKHINFKL